MPKAVKDWSAKVVQPNHLATRNRAHGYCPCSRPRAPKGKLDLNASQVSPFQQPKTSEVRARFHQVLAAQTGAAQLAISAPQQPILRPDFSVGLNQFRPSNGAQAQPYSSQLPAGQMWPIDAAEVSPKRAQTRGVRMGPASCRFQPNSNQLVQAVWRPKFHGQFAAQPARIQTSIGFPIGQKREEVGCPKSPELAPQLTYYNRVFCSLLNFFKIGNSQQLFAPTWKPNQPREDTSAGPQLKTQVRGVFTHYKRTPRHQNFWAQTTLHGSI